MRDEYGYRRSTLYSSLFTLNSFTLQSSLFTPPLYSLAGKRRRDPILNTASHATKIMMIA
jgi:hypothetical protein